MSDTPNPNAIYYDTENDESVKYIQRGDGQYVFRFDGTRTVSIPTDYWAELESRLRLEGYE